jgi:hypothetical protein
LTADTLARVRAAPAGEGPLELIVNRPRPAARELLESAEVDLVRGIVGDRWGSRVKGETPDDEHFDDQVTIMSSRAAALLTASDDHEQWARAGDQLFVDLDLSEANLPAGTRLAIGEVVVEVTPEPHLGCGKFIRRFGTDALKLANSAEGRALRLRGLHARVIEPGTISVGDTVRKLG